MFHRQGTSNMVRGEMTNRLRLDEKKENNKLLSDNLNKR